MSSLSTIRSDVDATVRAYLEDSSWMADLPGDVPLFAEFVSPALVLAESGKRTRAALLHASYLATGASDATPATLAGAALELYQISALVHDDVIDHSPTRRGKPAAHVAFESTHARSGWNGISADFGTAGGILLADMLLSLAMEACSDACALVGRNGPDALREFARMTAEVAFGQYLDVRAEHVSHLDDPIRAAMGVITHKSARYSVVRPLAIGARLGGADGGLVDALVAIGTPAGEAFQLRDDDLGIFGDARATGKPRCGDIAQGKRTVLLALTLERVGRTEAAWLRSRLGRKLDEGDAPRIQEIVETSGARAHHEALIAERERAAREAWRNLADSGAAHPSGVALLEAILGELSERSH